MPEARVETFRLERLDELADSDEMAPFVMSHTEPDDVVFMWNCPEHGHAWIFKSAQEALLGESDMLQVITSLGLEPMRKQGPALADMPRLP